VRRLLPIVAFALVAAPNAAAQDGGGVTAPDFTEPCPALYPGDGAEKPRIARWMGRAAGEHGLPHELPVMAALTESGLENIRGSSFSGYFGMSRALDRGDYRGFPRNPELQVKWFIDTATTVRQHRVAEGRPDPAKDPAAYGSWIADVERPAREYRSRYQTRLDEARGLIANKCAEPESADSTPPRLRIRLDTSQQPLGTGGITVDARCPDGDCLVGVVVKIGDLVRRAVAREPAPRGYTRLIARLPRAARKELRRGRTVRASVTAIAADRAANATALSRVVTLKG
jgi:hypothetical protein